MKILITDCTFADFLHEKEMCERNGYELIRFNCKHESELIEIANEVDAIFVQYLQLSSDIISKFERCKIIVRYGIGTDNTDLDAARKYGISVCNVPDYGVNEVADHTVSLILSSRDK